MKPIVKVTLIVVAIIAIGGLFLPTSKPVTKEIVKELGSVVGPNNPIPQVNLGELNVVGSSVALRTATSTVCAIQSPSATSTLVNAGVRFKLASTSAVVVDMANSPDRFATTTGTRINAAGGYAVGASAQATIVASSTGSVAGDATIFAPNRFFVVKYHDANNGAGNVSTGSCWALFAAPL